MPCVCVLSFFVLTDTQKSILNFKLQSNMKRFFPFFLGVLLCALLFPAQRLAAQSQIPTAPETDCDRCRNAREIDLAGRHAGGCDYILTLDYSDQCNVTSIVWDFGDNTPTITTGAVHTVTHQYAAAGIYIASATITIGTPPNTCTIVERNSINVTQCTPVNCGACSVVSPSGIFFLPPTANPCLIQWILTPPVADPACPNVSFSINYGDSPNSMPLIGLGQFSHQYPGNGSYNMCLTETHSGGPIPCTTTTCDLVTIKNCQVCAPCPITNPASLVVFTHPTNKCRVVAGASPFNGCADIDYSIDFGDGSPSVPYIGLGVQHVYQSGGSFTITLTETHFDGQVYCTSTRTRVVNMPGSCAGVPFKQADVDFSEFESPSKLTVLPNVLQRGQTTMVSWDSDVKPENLRLMDAQGKMVLQIQLSSEKSMRMEIPQSLPAGMYFLVLNDGIDGITKLIVE
jgi:PKD repeat protein